MDNLEHPSPESKAASTPSTGPTMPFGKFKRTPLDELPSEFLLWLGCLDDLRPSLLGAVLCEMARRLRASEPVPEGKP